METIEWNRALTVGSVGPDFIAYNYPVSSYRPSHSPLSQAVYLIPLLLHYPLKIGEGLRDPREGPKCRGGQGRRRQGTVGQGGE